MIKGHTINYDEKTYMKSACNRYSISEDKDPIPHAAEQK